MEGPNWILLVLLLPIVFDVQAQNDLELDKELNMYNKQIGSTPVDLVLLLDTSKATNTTEAQDEEMLIKSFFVTFLDDADIDGGAVRVAMVTYSTHPNLVFGLNRYKSKSEIQDAIFNATFTGGERNTADAIAMVRSQVLTQYGGDRPDVPNMVLALQTGKSDRNSGRTAQESEALKYARTIVFGLGVNLDQEAQEELSTISSEPVSENSFVLDDSFELTMIKDVIFAHIFTRAELVNNSPAAGSETLDVAFLLHYSSDFKKADFDNVLNFMKNMLQYGGLDTDKVRVAAAVYRKRASMLFDFNQYYTKDDILAGIETISHKYRAKSASAASGLELARTQLFNDQAGARRDVPDLLVLITDSNADVDTDQTIISAEQLKATGATIFTVGLNVTYKDELNAIATSPKTTLFVEDTEELAGAERSLQTQFLALRTEGLPAETTTTTTTTSTTTLEPTTTVTTTTVDNSESADIVFLIHASKSTKTKHFKKYLLKFLSRLAGRADHDTVNFAVVTYGKTAETIFDLQQQFSKKKLLMKSIRKVPKDKRYKTADLGEALKYVRTSVLIPEKGDSAEKPNGIVIITDQASTGKKAMERLVDEAAILRSSGVGVYAIGVGNDPELIQELERAVTEPGVGMTIIPEYSIFHSKSRDMMKNIAKRFRPFHAEELDLVIAVHSSKTTKFADIKKKLQMFLRDLVSSADIDSGAVRIGLVSFGPDVNVVFNLNEHSKTKKMFKTVKKLKPKSLRSTKKKTDMVSVLNTIQTDMFTQTNGDRPDVPNAIMVITDSPSTSDPSEFEQTVSSLKSDGTVLYSIGVNGANKNDLHTLASDPVEEFSYMGTDYDEFTKSAELRKSIAQKFKIFEKIKIPKTPKKPKTTAAPPTTTTKATPKPTTTTEPPTTAKPTSDKLVETTTTTASSVTFKSASRPKVTPLKQSEKADLVFAVHLSPKASVHDFFRMKEFLKDAISGADVESGDVQVGLMFYAADPQIVFHINQYKDMRQILSSIDGMREDMRSFESDASGALALGRQMISSYYDRREDVPAAIVFVTDGESNINEDLIEYERDRGLKNGINVYAAGIGLPDKMELERIATSSKNIMTLARYADIRYLSDDIKDKVMALQSTRATTTVAMTTEKTTTPTTTTAKPLEVRTFQSTDHPLRGLTLPTAPYQLTDITDISNKNEKRTEFVVYNSRESVRRHPTNKHPMIDDDPVQSIHHIHGLLNDPPRLLHDCGKIQVDIIFLLDTSSSMGRHDFFQMKEFVKYVASNLDISNGSSRVGIFTYNTRPTMEFTLDQHKTNEAVINAIDNIPQTYGNTNTAGALNAAWSVGFTKENGDRETIPNVLVLIADGYPNMNSRETVPEAQNVKDRGIFLYAFGVKITYNREFLQLPTPPSNRTAISLSNFQILQNYGPTFMETLCEDCPPPLMDIVFILDSSTSVGRINFQKMLEFVKSMLRFADVDYDGVRVGLITYNTYARIRFYLYEIRDRSSLYRTIDSIPYEYGNTNTYEALRTARAEVFTPERGDRPYAKNIIVLLNDGVSNMYNREITGEAQRLRDADIRVLAIGINIGGTTELDDIASAPLSENRIDIDTFDKLDELKIDLFPKSCRGSPAPEIISTALPVTTPKPTEPSPPSCATAKKDIVIILDSSTSVTMKNWDLILRGTQAFVRGLNIDQDIVRIGVLTFSSDAIIEFQLNAYRSKEKILRAIGEIKYRYGRTNTMKALSVMRREMFRRRNGDRHDVPNVALVITDGRSNINSSYVIDEADNVRKAGIKIFAVGIGLDVSTELEAIAGGENQTFSVRHFDELELKIDRLYRFLCPEKDKVVTTTIRTPTYSPQPLCLKTNIDVIFVLDSSTSVTEKNFKLMLKAAKAFISDADIDSGNTRIGLITYSSRVRVEFDLNSYDSKASLLEAFDGVRYIPGDTNTADAIHVMRTIGFKESNGERPNLPNIAIIVTDGNSNINSYQTVPEAELARQSGIQIFAIGVGVSKFEELDGIAGYPENRFDIERFDDLEFKLDRFYQNKCSGETTAVIPTTQSCRSTTKDVVFVLDSSTSMGEDNFHTMINAIKTVIASEDIDNGRTRIGLLLFSTDVYVQFHLNRYKTTEAILEAVDKIRYITGSTNTADALKTMHREMFAIENGARKDSFKVALVITDQMSNINNNRVKNEADQARADNIVILAIGVGLTNTKELDVISGSTENRLIVQNFYELQLNVDTLFRSVCVEEVEAVPELPLLSCDQSQMDLVFVLDSSTSVKDKDFESMLNATSEFVSTTHIDDGKVRIGVVTFSSNVQVQFELNMFTKKSDIITAITSIKQVKGDTNIADALRVVRTRMFQVSSGDRVGIPNIAVIFTDASPNVNTQRTIPEANMTKDEGIRLIIVAVGVQDSTELDKIASTPVMENKLIANDFDDLDRSLEKLFSTICHAPSLPLRQSCSLGRLDLVIILDASTSVTQSNFDKMLAFTKGLVMSADIDSGAVRVGVITYSTDVVVNFNLNDHATQADILDAIDQIRYLYGSTNSADAIKRMRSEMFTVANGDRPNVPNTAIIITDGLSNINSRRTITEARSAHRSNIRMYAIGIGLSDDRELIAMATSQADSFSVNDFDELSGLDEKLFSSLCTAPVKKPSRCGFSDLDLVIIIDGSTSVGSTNFRKVLEFCKTIVDFADVDSGSVRIAVIVYSSYVNIVFQLDRYNTSADIKNAIDHIGYPYGSTNTADALRDAYSVVFSREQGDRSGVKDAVMLITDGLSNINARRTIPEAENLRLLGMHLYAIGIGLSDTREIDAIASPPLEKNRFALTGFDDLADLPVRIFGAASPDLCVPAPRGCGLSEIDLVIILDASTSVTERNFKKMLDFCKDLVDTADVDSGSVRIGVLVYSTDVEAIFQLNRYTTSADIKNAIDQITYIYGSTNTADAILEMHDRFFTAFNGDRPGVDNVAIVLTDGISNINARRTVSEAQTARGKGIHIYAIGIGLTDTREVDAIASQPSSENSFNVQEFDELEGLADRIFGSGAGDECPKPVTTPPTPPCGLSKVDVIIILDASTSVTQKNFDKMLLFAKDIVDQADIDSGSVRVGALIYSTEVEIQFHLNRFSTKADIMAAIDSIPYIYGSTNSADAMMTMHNTMFTPGNGDRSDAENVAFMITDGVSNINARRTKPESQSAHDKGILVYAIGIGLTDTRELDSMASPPSSAHSFNVQEFDELTGLVDTIFKQSEACADSPPVADAGTDITIQLPVDFAKLNGDASSDDKAVVEYMWTQTSGDSSVQFDGANSAYLALYGLRAGEYVFTLSVKDALGQSDDDEVKITVEAADEPPKADAGGDITVQLPVDTATLSGKGSTDDNAVVEYSWRLKSGDQNVFLDGESSPELTLFGLQEGVYTFSLEVRDAQGQSDEDDVQITVEDQDLPPIADAGPDLEVFVGDDLTLFGTKSTDDIGIVNYSWKLTSGDADSLFMETLDPRNMMVSFSQPGIFVFGLTVTDANGQKDEDAVNITVQEMDNPPTADAGEDMEAQVDDNVYLIGEHSSDDKKIVQFNWALTSGNEAAVNLEGTEKENLMATFDAPGSYILTLTVTDEAGQKDSDEAQVIVKEKDLPPIAEAGEDLDVFTGENVILSGELSSDDKSIVQYRWSFISGDAAYVNIKDSDQQTMTLSIAKPGTYTFSLTVEDDIGQADQDEVQVTVTAQDLPPIADAGPDVYTDVWETIRLVGDQSKDDKGIVTYTWLLSDGDSDAVEMRNTDVDNPKVTFTAPGTYGFTLLVTDELGQTDKDTVEVTVKESPPVADAGADQQAKPGDTITLDGLQSTDDVGIVQYNWALTSGDAASVVMADEDQPSIQVLFPADAQDGSYEFSLTVTDGSGLQDEDTTVVVVTGRDYPPTADAGVDVETDPRKFITLSGQRSSDDKAIVRYQWRFVSGNQAAYRTENTDAVNLGVVFLEPGTYTFALAVVDSLGQTDEDTVTVTVKGKDLPPTADAGPDVLTPPRTFITISGDGSSDDKAIVRYQWVLVSGNQFAVRTENTDAANLGAVFLAPGTYTFALTVYDALGQTDEDTVQVTVEAPNVPPVANAGNDVTVQLPDDSVTLDGRASSDDQGIVQYFWSLQDGDATRVNMGDPNSSELRLRDLQPGTYTFGLVVADAQGDTSTDFVDVIVNPAPNQPPVANAGEDLIIQLPTDSVTLSGAASTDDIGVDKYRWRLKSGDDSSLDLRGERRETLEVTGMKAGEYSFSLTVVDADGARDSDFVKITVLDNLPPKADAGDNIVIQAPDDAITLRGDNSYDDIEVVEWAWALVRGDTTVVMENPDEPNLRVAGLKPGRYEFLLTVKDNMGQSNTDTVTIDVVEPATTVAPCGLDKVDLVFVVDASTSVTEANFKKQLNFINSIVQVADIDSGSVRIGALIYSTDVQPVFHLNRYRTKADVMDAVNQIPYIYGSTNTADALKSMRDEFFSYRNGDRDEAPNIAIVITDGVSNINARRTISEAQQSHDLGILVIAVGIGLTDTRELDAIATKPHTQNSYAVNAFDELAGLEKRIFSSTGCPESTTPTPTTTTIATTTTAGPTTPAPCGLAKTDLIFILDASTSVTEANFQKMRDFVKDFIRNADVDSGSVRVGVNIYSTDVQVQFNLNRYTTTADVQRAVDAIPYIYGSTNTADAIMVMRDDMFTAGNGDRADAPNIAIVVTDGISNINSRRTVPEARTTHGSNIHVYAIGIGLTDRRELDAIATPPASVNSFVVDSFDELKGLEQTIFTSRVCPDAPPVANAGSDVTLVLPDDSIVLSADLSTDDVGIVQYTWNLVDGPASVNVIETEGQYLKLDNLQEGVYEIELVVVDARGQKDTDTVILTVLPEPNEPPVANAGPDKTVQLPDDSVTIYGDKSYDDKRIVMYDWLVDFGTGGGRYKVKDDQLDLYDLEEGVVVVSLTVFDANGEFSTDIAEVTVLAEPDLPPRANAGPDKLIQLPVDTVRLDGSGSTDDVRVVSYNWKLSSGDGSTVRSSGADTPYLTLQNLREGNYDYTLTVGDKKGQTDSDTARVVVEPARNTGYDVIFVLDSSVSPQYFRWMTDYSRMLIREMSIDDGEFRVGYLIYSNGAYRQFHLNAYDTKDEVLAAVDKIGYRPGDKNTASALKYARKQMFVPSKGDRDYAPNYVIHLTGDALSMDPYDAATEACRLQNDGVGMFATGFGNVRDRTELQASSSLPTRDYESTVRNDRDFGEKPGLMIYQLKNGSPQPTPCPERTTLPPMTTTRRPPGPIKCTATGDVVFILDSSGSVGQDNFYRVLNFTYQTIDGLDVDSGQFRVGVTTFSDTSRLDFNLNEFNNIAGIKSALQSVVYMYGNTNTAHALRRVRTEMFTSTAGDRPDVPNIAVIITDGQSNVNHETTVPEARALKAAGVTILTVAVGFTSETSELVGLTSQPISENLIYVEDYESLDKLKDKLVEPLCTDSNLCRRKPCQNGGVCMDGIRTFTCMCPANYFGDTCGKECGDPADVVIVLDSSTSVGEYNFGRLKEYSEHLVRAMNKDSCDINLGFLKYSSDAMVQVYLGMHTDTETNIRALDRISYSRGRANMAAAFRALRTHMFNGAGGDRPNARNIAYFLSDGTNDVHAEMTESEADLTISSGVRIIPIGINMKTRYELENIAGVQGIDLIEIDDEPALIENTDTILRSLYEGNNFCDEDPCMNGGHCSNLPFGFSCQCPAGFSGDTCSKRCAANGDVVFAIDTSRYVTRSEMKKIRKFLRSIVKRLNFRSDGFNVGMVQFSDWAKVTMEFNQGNSKRNVRSNIAGLRTEGPLDRNEQRVHGGDPEPAQALAKANYRIFNGAGARSDKPDYLVLISKSMRKELDIIDEANKLKIQGVRIIGIGLGLTDSEKEAMQSTVSMPLADTAMFADDADDLADIGEKIVEFMCDDDDVCASNPCQNGGQCTKRGGEFYCECGVGFAGRFCQNRCNARADVVLLLDSSGSVGHVDFRKVKTFAHNLVGDLAIGKDQTRVGLASYSTESRHGFYMNKYFDMFGLQNAIAGIGYEYGNTNTAAGLRLVRERYFNKANGDRPEIQDFVIVITDGVSNVQPDQTLVEAQLLKDQGVHVYTVAIGDFDTTEIYAIASEPVKENAFILKDYSALSDMSTDIVKKTCRDPTVCDKNPCQNGGVCVPGINGAFCECPGGFRGEHCESSCVQSKDIFFVLDSSDSVGPQNWDTMLSFVSRIIEEFSSKDTYNRFSLITYSTDVQVVFSLGRYNTFSIIKNAVKYARYKPGRTNTAAALRTVHEFSTTPLGDRYDAENLVFLLTDGLSNVNKDDTIQASTVVKNSGARIIPIAINMDDYSEVDQIASSSGDVFKVESFNGLEGIMEDLYQAICKNGNEINRNGRK